MNKCFAGERLTTIGSNVNETEISQHPPQTQRLYTHTDLGYVRLAIPYL